MKRSSALGLRSGNLPACIDVDFTDFYGPPTLFNSSRSFLSEVGLCFGDFEGRRPGCGWMRGGRRTDEKFYCRIRLKLF